MIVIREEEAADVGAREVLLDRVFGPARFLKSSERIRKGRLPADGLALTAEEDGRLVGTVRLWHISAGGRAALLLGPIAIDPDIQGAGLGSRMMRTALELARAAGHGAVLLVGDPEYYVRFGFSGQLTAALTMPGPTERRRFLALELAEGFLAGVRGRVVPTGARILGRPAAAAARIAA